MISILTWKQGSCLVKCTLNLNCIAILEKIFKIFKIVLHCLAHSNLEFPLQFSFSLTEIAEQKTTFPSVGQFPLLWNMGKRCNQQQRKTGINKSALRLRREIEHLLPLFPTDFLFLIVLFQQQMMISFHRSITLPLFSATAN